MEKLNANNKNKIIKPYEFLNNNNIIPISTSKNAIMPLNLSKKKDKKVKFQKQITLENDLDSKNKNKDNLSSSSYTNSNNQNDDYLRKYSENSNKNNNELNKVKNANSFSNYSNNTNHHQIDWNKKDNPLNYDKTLNILKMKNNTINNKYTIDLKNHNNLNNNNFDNNNNLVKIKNNNEKEKNVNSQIEKGKKIFSSSLSNNNNDIDKNIVIKINENPVILKKNNLTVKEKACYILSKSPIIPLYLQMIFSRSSNNIKQLITKKEILKNYELFLNNKIKEYEKKIITYNKKITSIFTSSKIAEINLNFITKNNEIEFCETYNELLCDKKDFNFIYYNNYIKIIYYIINANIEDNISDEILLINLYKIIKKRGYNNIKDYLYFLFISNNNNNKENYFIENFDKIDEIVSNKFPSIFNIDESMKMGKFIIFSSYLIKEIIDFGKFIKDTTKLQMDTKIFIHKLKDNLEKFKFKYIK